MFSWDWLYFLVVRVPTDPTVCAKIITIITCEIKQFFFFKYSSFLTLLKATRSKNMEMTKTHYYHTK